MQEHSIVLSIIKWGILRTCALALCLSTHERQSGTMRCIRRSHEPPATNIGTKEKIVCHEDAKGHRKIASIAYCLPSVVAIISIPIRYLIILIAWTRNGLREHAIRFYIYFARMIPRPMPLPCWYLLNWQLTSTWMNWKTSWPIPLWAIWRNSLCHRS